MLLERGHRHQDHILLFQVGADIDICEIPQIPRDKLFAKAFLVNEMGQIAVFFRRQGMRLKRQTGKERSGRA